MASVVKSVRMGVGALDDDVRTLGYVGNPHGLSDEEWDIACS
jgi:hypothetical protein